MNINSWWFLLIFIVCGSLSTTFGIYLQKRRSKLEYTWTCQEDGCNLHIEGSNPSALLFIAGGHMEARHGME